jgi:hypothetical protein
MLKRRYYPGDKKRDEYLNVPERSFTSISHVLLLVGACHDSPEIILNRLPFLWQDSGERVSIQVEIPSGT